MAYSSRLRPDEPADRWLDSESMELWEEVCLWTGGEGLLCRLGARRLLGVELCTSWLFLMLLFLLPSCGDSQATGTDLGKELICFFSVLCRDGEELRETDWLLREWVEPLQRPDEGVESWLLVEFLT